MQIKVLCIGDLVGRPGRHVLHEKLAGIVEENEIDCVICNVENAAGGSGLTDKIHSKLLNQGVHLMTMGDHIYRKRDIIATLQNSKALVKPANLAITAAGQDYAVYHTAKGASVAVVSLLGRMYMNLQADNPYNAIDRILSRIPSDIRIIIVDMHAEATSEKIAMGWHLDGRVSVVFGTHTHVMTADERVLPKGTGYITDVGMTGPHESVIGRNVEPVLKSLTTNMPFPFSIATNDLRMNGIIATINSHTGQTSEIKRITVSCDYDNGGSYDQDDR
ncbi:MAG: TIGR00282 family metallophosphoesterase [Phycisphaerae bacterium]|nr:TIGR00282 family metallophosphoesterase [Phycisphaerae bacterium]